jgi:hypothetical protein
MTKKPIDLLALKNSLKTWVQQEILDIPKDAKK